MHNATYSFTGNTKIPSEITFNGNSTPVWIQQEWDDGEYAEFIRRNGCGHCCTAMALNLHGIKINPHEEFALCRKKWGEPRMGEPLEEDNFMSVCGIVKILAEFDVSAQGFGVPVGESEKAAEHIVKMLREGKQVIFWSHPSEKLENNPFSSGEHYVLAVSISDDGKILIANSSKRAETSDGIQFTDRETLAAVLYEGADPQDFTWGRYDLAHNGGYVVVG